MKFKKMMLVALILLAVLTIGAVSASDDADFNETLTVDDADDASLDASLDNEMVCEDNLDNEVSSFEEETLYDDSSQEENESIELYVSDVSQGSDASIWVWFTGVENGTYYLSLNGLMQERNFTSYYDWYQIPNLAVGEYTVFAYYKNLSANATFSVYAVNNYTMNFDNEDDMTGLVDSRYIHYDENGYDGGCIVIEDYTIHKMLVNWSDIERISFWYKCYSGGKAYLNLGNWAILRDETGRTTDWTYVQRYIYQDGLEYLKFKVVSNSFYIDSLTFTMKNGTEVNIGKLVEDDSERTPTQFDIARGQTYINITLTNSNGYPICREITYTINGGEEKVIRTNFDGYACIHFLEGDVAFNVMYVGDKYEKSCSAQANFTFSNESSIDISVSDMIYHTHDAYPIAKLNVIGDVTGNIRVLVDNVTKFNSQIKDLPFSFEDETFYIPAYEIDYELYPGNHSVTVVYENGNLDPIECERDVEFKIPDLVINITTRDREIHMFFSDEFGNLITHTYMEIKYYLNGVEYTAYPNYGEIGIYDIDGVRLDGDYELKVFYEGTDMYNSANASANLSFISKVKINILNQTIPATFDGRVIEIGAVEGLSGNLQVDYNGDITRFYSIDYMSYSPEDNVYYIPFTDFSSHYNFNPGHADITVYYYGNELSEIVHGYLDVYRLNTTLSLTNKEDTVIIKLEDGMGMPIRNSIHYTLKGQENWISTNEEGIAIISNLLEGYNELNVFYDGSQVYNPANASATFKILKNPNLSLQVSSVDEGNPVNVHVTGDGALVDEFTLRVADREYNVTLTNGNYHLAVDLPAGDYVASVSYGGGDKYYAVERFANFMVNSLNKHWVNLIIHADAMWDDAPAIITISAYYPSYSYYDESTGEIIEIIGSLDENFTNNVSVEVTGWDYELNTNYAGYNAILPIVNGTGSFELNLRKGSYTVYASYEENSMYWSGYSQSMFFIYKANAVIDTSLSYVTSTVSDEVYVTLQDFYGVNVANETVYYTINNVTYSGVTDRYGQITISNLTDPCTISVVYNGSDVYSKSSKDIKYKVNPKITINGDASVWSYLNLPTVININADERINDNVTITLNKVTYNVTLTNGSGQLKIYGLKEGYHYAKLTYSGDETFSAVTKNFYVDVKHPNFGEGIIDDEIPVGFYGHVLWAHEIPDEFLYSTLRVIVIDDYSGEVIFNSTTRITEEGIKKDKYHWLLSDLDIQSGSDYLISLICEPYDGTTFTVMAETVTVNPLVIRDMDFSMPQWLIINCDNYSSLVDEYFYMYSLPWVENGATANDENATIRVIAKNVNTGQELRADYKFIESNDKAFKLSELGIDTPGTWEIWLRYIPSDGSPYENPDGILLAHEYRVTVDFGDYPLGYNDTICAVPIPDVDYDLNIRVNYQYHTIHLYNVSEFNLTLDSLGIDLPGKYDVWVYHESQLLLNGKLNVFDENDFRAKFPNLNYHGQWIYGIGPDFIRVYCPEGSRGKIVVEVFDESRNIIQTFEKEITEDSYKNDILFGQNEFNFTKLGEFTFFVKYVNETSHENYTIDSASKELESVEEVSIIIYNHKFYVNSPDETIRIAVPYNSQGNLTISVRNLANNDIYVIDHEIVIDDYYNYIFYNPFDLNIKNTGRYEITVKYANETKPYGEILRKDDIIVIGFDMDGEIWMNLDDEFSTSDENLDAIFAAVKVPDGVEGNITITVDGKVVFNKALSDFDSDYVDDENNVYALSIRNDGKFIFGEFDGGNDAAIKVIDEDGNEAFSYEFRVNVNGDTVNFRGDDVQHTNVIIWNEDDMGPLYTDCDGDVVSVDVPPGFEGTISVWINGEEKSGWNISHELEGDWAHHDWGLGELEISEAHEYVIEVKYNGETIADGKINVFEKDEDSFRVEYDDEDGITFTLFCPEGAAGTVMIVIKGEDDQTVRDDITHEITAQDYNNPLEWSVSDFGLESGCSYLFNLTVNGSEGIAFSYDKWFHLDDEEDDEGFMGYHGTDVVEDADGFSWGYSEIVTYDDEKWKTDNFFSFRDGENDGKTIWVYINDNQEWDFTEDAPYYSCNLYDLDGDGEWFILPVGILNLAIGEHYVHVDYNDDSIELIITLYEPQSGGNENISIEISPVKTVINDDDCFATISDAVEGAENVVVILDNEKSFSIPISSLRNDERGYIIGSNDLQIHEEGEHALNISYAGLSVAGRINPISNVEIVVNIPLFEDQIVIGYGHDMDIISIFLRDGNIRDLEGTVAVYLNDDENPAFTVTNISALELDEEGNSYLIYHSQLGVTPETTKITVRYFDGNEAGVSTVSDVNFTYMTQEYVWKFTEIEIRDNVYSPDLIPIVIRFDGNPQSQAGVFNSKYVLYVNGVKIDREYIVFYPKGEGSWDENRRVLDIDDPEVQDLLNDDSLESDVFNWLSIKYIHWCCEGELEISLDDLNITSEDEYEITVKFTGADGADELEILRQNLTYEINPDYAAVDILDEVKYRNEIPFLFTFEFADKIYSLSNNVIIYINGELAFNGTTLHYEENETGGLEIVKLWRVTVGMLNESLFNEYGFLDVGDYEAVVYLVKGDDPTPIEMGRNNFTVFKQKGNFTIDLITEEDKHTYLYVDVPEGNWEDYSLIINIGDSEEIYPEYIEDNGWINAPEGWVDRYFPDFDPQDDWWPGWITWFNEYCIFKDNQIILKEPLDNIIGKGRVPIDLGILDGNTHVFVAFNYGREPFYGLEYGCYNNEFSINNVVPPIPVDSGLVIAPVGEVEEGSDVLVVVSANDTFSGVVSVLVGGNVVATIDMVDGSGNVTVASGNFSVGENTVKVTSEASELFNAGEHSTKFNVVPKVLSNIITPLNFDDYFDDDGVYIVDLEDIIFEGDFTGDFKITIDKDINITGINATFTNVCFNFTSVKVSISNLTFNFDYSSYLITFNSSDYVSLVNNTFNAQNAIRMLNCTAFNIESNTITSTSGEDACGICISEGGSGVVKDNQLDLKSTKTAYAISTNSSDSSNVIYINNTIEAESYFSAGIYGDSEEIRDNKITLSGNYAIGIVVLSDALVIDNEITLITLNTGSEDVHDPIGIETAGIKVNNNATITYNGIDSTGKSLSVVGGSSTISDNILNGQVSIKSNGNTISNNKIAAKEDYAIDLGDSTGNVIDGNEMYSSQGNGNQAVKPNEGNEIINNFEKYDPELAIAVDNITEGDVVVIRVAANATFSGDVLVWIGGLNFTVSLTNGTGSYQVSGLAADTYVAIVIFNATNVFVESTVNTTFVVKAKEVLPVVNPVATVIKATEVTTTYGTSKSILITLTDANGNAVSGRKVTVDLNGVKKELTTDDKGQVSYDIGTKLAPQTYTAAITFDGDDGYAKSAGSAKVVVNKAKSVLTAKKKTFKVKKAKKYTVMLKSDKTAIKKAKVTITIKAKGKKIKITKKTNKKGKVTFNLKKLTKKGKFSATVKFAGNQYYKPVTKKAKITVK